MEISPTLSARTKLISYILTSILIFVAICLTIAVLHGASSTDGRTAYYFALCFITIPILIYLGMTGRFPRTKKFANIYAFATLDILSTIFWFAAFVSVATWNSAGMKQGAAKNGGGSGNCSTFAWGSSTVCQVSEATVGFGVIIFLIFAVTSFLSVHTVLFYRRNGFLPEIAPVNQNDDDNIEAQTKSAFSNNDYDHEDMDEPGHDRFANGATPMPHGGPEEDEHALLHENRPEPQPAQPPAWGRQPMPQGPTAFMPEIPEPYDAGSYNAHRYGAPGVTYD